MTIAQSTPRPRIQRRLESLMSRENRQRRRNGAALASLRLALVVVGALFVDIHLARGQAPANSGRDPSPGDVEESSDEPGAGANAAPGAPGRPGAHLPPGAKRPKPDFSRLQFRLQLHGREDGLHIVKAGHWTDATLTTTANHFDFQGALTLGACRQTREPLGVEGTPFYLSIERPAVLPKAQKKTFVAPFFTPRMLAGPSRRPWVDCTLKDAETGIRVQQELDELQPLLTDQFQFLVLTKRPERFAYLQMLPTIRTPLIAISQGGDTDIYRLVAPTAGSRAPLPANALMWSTLAFIVWDDLPAAALDERQQQALVDWLHWGGHLIVSGPRALEQLGNGFLRPYLPADSSELVEIPVDRFAALDDRWSPSRKEKDGAALAASRPWPGAKLRLLEGGRFVPDTDELAAERRVGRGRVLVASFSLAQPGIAKWRGFDGFLNSCLMRGPVRGFSEEPGNVASVNLLNRERPEGRGMIGESLTHLRFFSRDAARDSFIASRANSQTNSQIFNAGALGTVQDIEPEEYGPAAWKDFWDASSAARACCAKARESRFRAGGSCWRCSGRISRCLCR